MKALHRVLFWLCLTALLFSAVPARAGWTLLQVDADEHKDKLFFQAGLVRLESRGTVAVFNTNTDRVCLFNRARREYWCGTPGQIRAAVDQDLDAGAKEKPDKNLEKQLKKMPPKERQALQKALEKQLKAKPPTQPPARQYKVDIKKTAETDHTAGFQVRKYEIRINGLLRQELWLAPAVDAAREVDFKKFRRMRAALLPEERQAWRYSDRLMALLKKGYPLIAVEYQNGRSLVTEVVSAVKKKLPASLFQQPEGFQPVKADQALKP